MKTLLCSLVGLVAATTVASATPLLSDTFNSYQNGNLVGQGGWLRTGTDDSTPIQVNSGVVTLGQGQDLYCPVTGAAYTPLDGTSLYMGLDLNISAATTGGDYFLHYSTTLGNTTALMDRLYVKSAGSGSGKFLFGWAGASGGASYGATQLNLNQSYHIVLAYNKVAGLQNDTAQIYVDPSDLVTPGNNSAYNSWTGTWAGGNEASPVAEICLRQGGASAPTLTLDNLVASAAFSDAASPIAVPEPQGLAWMGGAMLLAWNLIRRRR